MIREFQRDDINKVADIWLDTNIKAHNFIPAKYWKSNFKSVKEALLLAEVYVYEYDTEIQGFIGLNDVYYVLSSIQFKYKILTNKIRLDCGTVLRSCRFLTHRHVSC